jgi:hypothetical protein
MLDMATTAADRLGQVLTDEFKRTFGSGHSDRAERLGSIARVAGLSSEQAHQENGSQDEARNTQLH